MIALTNNPSILRNIREILAKHPKQMEIDKLGCKCTILENKLKRAIAQHDLKRIEELEQKRANCRKQIGKIKDEMRKEILSEASVIFNPSEKGDDDLAHFRPDTQLIVNKNYHDKISTWAMLSQVPI